MRNLFSNKQDVMNFLEIEGQKSDNDINISLSALALSYFFHPKISIDRYISHLNQVTDTVKDWIDELLDENAPDTIETRIDVLTKVIHTEYEYAGDIDDYDNIDNTNIIRVIDRKKGIPVALGIIYLHIAHQLDWDITGLSFPGHFILRFSHQGQIALIDPFRQGQVLNAVELRIILKSVLGENAELSHEYYNTVTIRDVLVRLQNNLKTRLIEQEEYALAIESIEALQLIAPDEYRLLFDLAVLHIKLENYKDATITLEKYIKETPYIHDRDEAHALLNHIRSIINNH